MRLATLHEDDNELHQALQTIYGVSGRTNTTKMQQGSTQRPCGMPDPGPPPLDQARVANSPIDQSLMRGNPPQTMRFGSQRLNDAGIPPKQRHRRFFGIKDGVESPGHITEEYRFNTQTWVNDDKIEYSVKKLAKWAEQHAPLRTVPISEIMHATGASEAYRSTPAFVKRSQKIDGSHPILIGYRGNDVLAIIDGRHRIRQARDRNIRYIKARLLNLAELPRKAMMLR